MRQKRYILSHGADMVPEGWLLVIFLIKYPWLAELRTKVTHTMVWQWNNKISLWHKTRGDEYAVKKEQKQFIYKEGNYFILYTWLLSWIDEPWVTLSACIWYLIRKIHQYSLETLTNFYINQIATHGIPNPTIIMHN